MTKVKEIIKEIELLCPLDDAEDFDNVGLLVGSSDMNVTGVLVTLDCLESSVEEAVENNCNLIISFHPIIFKGIKKLNGKNYVEKTVISAIKHDVAIYAMHTALDNRPGGVSGKMAQMLGLSDPRVLLPKKGQLCKLTTYVPEKYADEVRNALLEAGAGQLGNYSHCSFNLDGTGTYMGNKESNPAIGNPGVLEHVNETFISVIFEKYRQSKIIRALLEHHPYEEVAYDVVALENINRELGMGIIGELPESIDTNSFLNELKSTFGTGVIRHSELVRDHIRKVAVLGGSGSFAIEGAIRAGADIFVTADLKYHDFYRAEGKLILADIGHYESEQFTKNLLVEYLTKKITNFAPAWPKSRIILSKINTNPINYF